MNRLSTLHITRNPRFIKQRRRLMVVFQI